MNNRAGKSLNQQQGVEVFSLASGSSGNCTLIKSPGCNVLIDAGLGIRKLSSLLHGKGVAADELHVVLVTHEHIDHTSGLGAIARRCNAGVVANASTLHACALRDELSFETTELATGSELSIKDMVIRSFPVSHDAVEPVGYVVTVGSVSITYFTDTGYVSPEVYDSLRGANLAIVESNHDLEWLRRGPYTRETKARVESKTGHLSNIDCGDLVARRIEEGGPLTIWLAHLSRVNNSPSLAKRTVETQIKSRTNTPFVLDIALRDSPSASWSSRRGAGAVQLDLGL